MQKLRKIVNAIMVKFNWDETHLVIASASVSFVLYVLLAWLF